MRLVPPPRLPPKRRPARACAFRRSLGAPIPPDRRSRTVGGPRKPLEKVSGEPGCTPHIYMHEVTKNYEICQTSCSLVVHRPYFLGCFRRGGTEGDAWQADPPAAHGTNTTLGIAQAEAKRGIAESAGHSSDCLPPMSSHKKVTRCRRTPR